MALRTVQIDDTLEERIQGAKDETEELLRRWLDENHDTADGEPDTPCLSNDLDYFGSYHEIVDSATPIYDGEIDDLFYLYGDTLEQAYEWAGIGDKSESNWKAVAIYCHIEQEVAEWYSNEADDIVAEWWSENRPAARAASRHMEGDYDGLVVEDTGDVPEDYEGEVLHVNDHGNATLYNATGGELEEIDAIA